MHNWFQCKIKYEKNAEDGGVIKVSEAYLVDALSFTEAEERINEEMRPFISGEFLVSDIKRAKINELFTNENGDRWYRAKVNFISLDEEKGGDLAGRLGSLYDYMVLRLLQANLKNDDKALEEVAGLISELHSAWREISPAKQAAA